LTRFSETEEEMSDMTTKAQQSKLHEEAIEWASKELRDIMERSEHGIYIYACDTHTVCNEKFAKMLGLGSPEEWGSADGESLVDKYLAPASAAKVVDAYWQAMEDRLPSSVDVTLRPKGGGRLRANIVLLPFRYKDQDLALHFITPKE
jgi:PAS domain-containing protein